MDLLGLSENNSILDSNDKANLANIEQPKYTLPMRYEDWKKCHTINSDDVWQEYPLPVLEKCPYDIAYYDLLRKKTYLIGKANSTADVKINDLSVSSSHAEISCIKKIVDCKVQLFLQVIDKNSKFGTFVRIKSEDKKNSNNSFRRIESEQPILLSNGESIRFGLNESGCFKFASRKYFITKDDLNEADLKTLKKEIMIQPGISFLSNSPHVTHYVISNSIFDKAILGLATLKPIVTVQYFIDLCKALLPNSTELPVTEDYVPDLMESLLSLSSEPVSLDINPLRKKVFIGKKFLCSTIEQLVCVVDIISAGGGAARCYTNCDNVNIDDILNKSGYILMEQDPKCSKPDEKYQLLLEQLKTMNRRPIPENDIALAVLFGSTEKYCNPHYNMPLVDFQFDLTFESDETLSNSQEYMIIDPIDPMFQSGHQDFGNFDIDSLSEMPFTERIITPDDLYGFDGIRRLPRLKKSRRNFRPKKRRASLETTTL